jgi:hypothetical protein
MKFICVPVDNDALKRLDFDENIDGDLLEIILKEDIFDKLIAAGFFSSINKLTGAMIDNFEDEGITDAVFLRRVVESPLFEKTSNDNLLAPIVKEIEILFGEAIVRKTGIFFYF